MPKALFAFGLVLLLGHPGNAAEDAVTAAARRNFSEYLELLAIPNIPEKPDDMRRNAAFLEHAFQKRGLSTQLLDNPAGRPLVFARSDAAAPVPNPRSAPSRAPRPCLRIAIRSIASGGTCMRGCPEGPGLVPLDCRGRDDDACALD